MLGKKRVLLFILLLILMVPFQSRAMHLSGQSTQLATEYNALLIHEGYGKPLYLLDLETGSLKRVADGVRFHISVSPDGRLVAYDFDGQLYVSRIDGTELKQVSISLANIESLAWSSSSQHLAYITRLSDYTQSELWILDIDTWENKRVDSELPPNAAYSEVDWIPHSQALILGVCNQPYGCDLYRVNDDGSDLTNVTNTGAAIEDFRLSPDGRTVAFITYENNVQESEKAGETRMDYKAYLTNLETLKTTEIMHYVLHPQIPAGGWTTSPWSPDSEWILLPPSTVASDMFRAFTPEGKFHHKIIELVIIVDGEVGIRGLVSKLSPDGQILAGSGRFTKEGDECLCAVNTDGTNFRELVPSIHVGKFFWSPDSESIFLTYEQAPGMDLEFGVVNADGSGLYDPFADLAQEFTDIRQVFWLRLDRPTPMVSPTTTSIPTQSPTASLTPTPTPLPTKTATATPLPTKTATVTPSATATIVPQVTVTTLPKNHDATSTPQTTPTPLPTSSPGSSLCGASGIIVALAVLFWWKAQKR